MSVVAPQSLDAGKHVLGGIESEQPFPRRQVAAETGFLGQDRSAGCQIADAAVTKPAAARGNVTTFRDTEFRFGPANELAVAGWRAGHIVRVHELPTIVC